MKRRNVATLSLLTAIALPLAYIELAPVSASASGPDTIQFTQTSGSSKAYFKYVPGDGSTTTTQNVTGGGGCSSPTIGTAVTGRTQGTTDPLLGWSPGDWSSQTDYTGTRTAAIVGAYNGETGVCAEGANFSIDNVPAPSSGNSKWGLEALDFSPGTNAVEGSGRIFTRATINIANNTSSATQVNLIETLNGQVVGTQNCPLAGTTKSKTPAIVATDTKVAGSVCTGTDPSISGFDNIEIQVPDVGESVSVVQTSTFYLGGGTICGGQTISASDQSGSTGGVSASITLDAASNVCKTYSNFAVSANDPDPNVPGYPKIVIFSGTGGSLPSGAHLSTTIDWGDQPECDPSTCPPTKISFDNGQTYVPQTFCSAADPTDTTTPWCTTSKKFSYEDVNGTTMTHVVETWDGIGDPAPRSP